ncbi:nuclear transport factor 2 family protein [Amycolatopsis saalfeldensis]|uniref:Ketosteroid isomerase-related protein n=1 Tax=Amycolatopsis saalfeldensis TaxID=394193 RepID=A0A1H8YLI4_9PSEU|nr:nuclear transport factor 2 family protein [Amycolatopsis saalfeldensis]SEP52933.1 Ketosteroid isomerase-related protein [Amycolatopsis saalfeldensis]
MTPSAELPAVVGRYFAAVNARDWAAIVPCFTEDAEFWMLGARTAHGAAEIAEQLRKSLEPLPESHDEVVRLAADGTMVLAELVFRARTPAGEAFELNAADVFELAPGGEAITRVSNWAGSPRKRG